MEEQLEERIVVDPDVIAGKPVIRGTRIPVDIILRRLAAGMSVSDVLDDYPNLQPEDVKAALEYAARVVGEEDNSC